MWLLERLPWSTSVGIAVVTLVALGMHIRFTRRAAVMGPTLLTTLGIGFCFFGIALGLVRFDAGDIRGSVPTLIDGIRTAFWVSVFGIGWAITVKLRLFVFGDPPAAHGSGHTLGDVVAQLERLHASLAGDEEGTLASRIARLNADTNARLDELRGAYQRFAEHVTEANMAALRQALSDILRNFNTKLDEQIGGNFKRLNEAAEKLAAWQERHKTQLEQLVAAETQSAANMTAAAQRYTELVSRATVFLHVSESLARVLPNLERQTQILEASLRELGDLVPTSPEQAGAKT
ncbi:MAG TPA: hypothetical protein VFJ95_03110, partial [Gammaproteobacteria bacterium]|nr:hypothetical protein [Gammaproteobacteria bacterium]